MVSHDDDRLWDGKAKGADTEEGSMHCSLTPAPIEHNQNSHINNPARFNSTWHIRHVEAWPSKLCIMPPPT